MVTVNKGRAMPNNAAHDNVGSVKIGRANCSCTWSMCISPLLPAIATPTSKVAITA
ncbi:hypothetical protein D3C71_1862840 [compost metagenome]